MKAPAMRPLSREALEFLPAVLEVQETPPLPLARAILWAIAGCLVAAVAWSALSRVDVVAVAGGKVIPSGKSKPVQAFESGRVRAIRVGEGDRVREGDVLVELDAAVSAADVNAARERIAKLERTLPLIRERASAAARLERQGLLPRSDYLALAEQRIAAEQDLAELRQELVKAQERQSWQTLRAPVSGRVQQLAVHAPGAVVTPAEALMVIVPGAPSLEVEAYVANKDIGFVSAGQDVEIKLEAFPFTRYGTLPGRVVGVSDDAIADDKLGLVYLARVALGRPDIEVDGRSVRLSPGMVVSVEIRTGRRRVIEYFLSPLSGLAHDSLRER